MHDPGLAVVVLAGGEGTRIGGAKPLRLAAGRSLIDRALDLAFGWSDQVAVAVRSPTQIGAARGASLVVDEGNAGPLEGLRSALRFACDRKLDRVLTIACDVPLLPADLPERLASALRPGIGAAVARSAGRLHASEALWRSDALQALAPYLASGQSSLRGFAARIGYAEVEWPVAPYDPFLNVNDQAGLEAAEALLRSR